MSNQVLAACAEFPNDNRGLHRGAIWHGADVTGPAACELPLAEVVVAQLTATTPGPAPVICEPIAAAEPEAVEAVQAIEPSTDPSPPVLEAEDEGDDIEIVDEIVLEHVVDESIPPPPPPAADDPFVALTAVLEDVAKSAGAGEPAMAILRTLLGRERLADDAPADLSALRTQAAGWQAILRGDSEDFTLVGSSSLDEWSSIVVARAIGEPSRADALRRELRRRGVAAFGLVIEAA